MTFLIILICLSIERFFDFSHLRRFAWFERYQHWIQHQLSSLPPYVILLGILLPIVAAVGIIEYLTWHAAFGLFRLLFGVAILLYCLGPGNLWQQATTCFKAWVEGEGLTAATECTRNNFGILSTQDNAIFQRSFAEAIYVQGNQRIFTVLFWFALLGPVGAVLYRLVTLCNPAVATTDEKVTEQAAFLQHLLEWLPLRLLAFSFGLVGNFTRSFSLWLDGLGRTDLAKGNKFLADCGVAAQDVTEADAEAETHEATLQKQALDLLTRALILWLVLLAILVLV